MPIHDFEGFSQASAAFAVELLDGSAKFGDCFVNIGALGLDACDFVGNPGEVIIGLQVDAAKAFAICLQPGQAAVHVVVFRQG